MLSRAVDTQFRLFKKRSAERRLGAFGISFLFRGETVLGPPVSARS
jgi:hypothetical protein